MRLRRKISDEFSNGASQFRVKHHRRKAVWKYKKIATLLLISVASLITLMIWNHFYGTNGVIDIALQKPTLRRGDNAPNAKSSPDTDDFDHYAPGSTGAFADCTENTYTSAPSHPHQHMITISCHTLPYRVPPISSSEQILVGVLSSAGGEGSERRQSIRETWAKNHLVLFLVAGPWEDIEDEYNEYNDLIWIKEEEVYDGEKSVLTYKTMALVKVVHNLASEPQSGLNIQYIFKTDDDSYIQIPLLHKILLEEDHEEYNYWGNCRRKLYKPLRDQNNKWSISYEMYPEPRFPRYCQGAGFALSWKFIQCAAGSENHIAKIRFMPFEDVAMGLLAQRCGFIPTMVDDQEMFHMYRTDTSEEIHRVNNGLSKIDRHKLPMPDMEGRIVQHRIDGAWDMKEHYWSIHDPDYEEKTTVNWYSYDD